MKKRSIAKELGKPVHPTISFVALIAFVAIGVLFVFVRLQSHPHVVSQSLPIGKTTSTPTSTLTPIMTKIFTSPDLGIRFAYAASTNVNGGVPINALQVGEKIYVYETDQKPEGSMYVEAFSKDPQDSIIGAIKKRILQGYSTTDCLAQITDPLINPTIVKKYEPKSYQYAIITIPNWTKLDLVTLNTLAAKCPSPYTYLGNGNDYFLTDSNHPTKLLFLNLGQSGISAGNPDAPQLGWQDTIQFLDPK